MTIENISSEYQVRHLTPQDVDAIYRLSVGNPMYFQYCPPCVTKESILEDMTALPPGRSPEDKFYVGFFQAGALIAVMDLIFSYPMDKTAWIGLFMMDADHQGRGKGSRIIAECAAYLKDLGFDTVQLAFAKGNPQSESFWTKNGFERTGRETQNEGYTAVVMEKKLCSALDQPELE